MTSACGDISYSSKMLKIVIHRLLSTSSTLSRQASRPFTLVTSLQSVKQISSGTAEREMRKTAQTHPDIKTPHFQHFWQPGSGYYGDSLGRLTKNAMDICENFVLSHIDYVPIPSAKGVFTIGDYGTCDGGVSHQLVYKIIDHMRKTHGPDLNIQVLYEDQPSNDFNSLFKNIYDKESYTSEFDNVFPLVCGTDFYKQCVPQNSCDIIISSMAAHWLNVDSVVRCSNSILPWRCPSGEELRAFDEICARDWQKFLILRAAELKPGGLLFVAQLSRYLVSGSSQSPAVALPVSHDITQAPEECARDIFLTFESSWKELFMAGIITKEEWQACVLTMAMRTLQEIKSSFQTPLTSPVQQAGLHLLHEPDVLAFPCFAKAVWRQKLQTDGVDDRNCFAHLLTKAMRVVFEAAFRNSLRSTRSADEKSTIIEQVFEMFGRKVASSDPNVFQSEFIIARLVAQKLQ